MAEVTVRPVIDDDAAEDEAVRRVTAAAFGDDGELIVRILDALEVSGKLAVSLVAERGGVVVGHVGLSRAWVDARERLVDVLVLSPLSVSPDHQRAGIGGALIVAALEAARDEGSPAVFLEGDPGYYSRHGFEPGVARGFLRPSLRIPEPAFQVCLLDGHERWMTGALVYCDAFWELDAVGLRGDVLDAVEERLGTVHP